MLPEDGSYLPARDIETIKVRDVLKAVELGMLGDNLFGLQVAAMPAIEQVIGKLDAGIAQSLSEESIRTLLLSSESAAGSEIFAAHKS